jgi:enoyl-[acyl-carrier protein] reductase I
LSIFQIWLNLQHQKERTMGNNLLKGKKGIIFGALNSESIAWKTAEKCFEEGAEFILTNAPIALRMGEINELADRTKSEVIACDVSKDEDMEALIDAAVAKYGKIDFILHSVGMSLNIRKNKPYTGSNYDFMHKTLDISAISFHRLLQTCYNKDI